MTLVDTHSRPRSAVSCVTRGEATCLRRGRGGSHAGTWRSRTNAMCILAGAPASRPSCAQAGQRVPGRRGRPPPEAQPAGTARASMRVQGCPGGLAGAKVRAGTGAGCACGRHYPTLPYPHARGCRGRRARLRAELDIRVVQLHNVVADPAQVVQRVRRLRRLRVALPAHASAGSGHQAALDAQLLSFEHAAFS